MKIKSYFSRSVEDAMAMARQELGSEAMLVNSRRTPIEARHLGDYEVIFAVDLPGPAVEDSSDAPATAPGRTGESSARLSSELADLKREMENMRRLITRTAFTSAHWAGVSSDASDACAGFAAAEVLPELAREIISRAESRAGKAAVPFRQALAEELVSRFTTRPELGSGPERPRIVALVGPPGAGKTTTLVKLAANYGLAVRRPVVLFSADTYRVGAADQLRSYAAILGVGFQLLDTITALGQAIEESRGKDLIFIDTPGFGPGDLESAAPLAAFLAARNDIDTHLVVASSMKSADISRVVDTFEIFRPQRLLFTKLDETGSFGPILNETVRTGKPLSFLTTGQRIPEDLEEATAKRLADLVLAGQRALALSAA